MPEDDDTSGRTGEQLEGARKGSIGFALTASGLQRRLASSPEAIYQSLKRRRERLESRLRDEKLGVGQCDRHVLAETLADHCCRKMMTTSAQTNRRKLWKSGLRLGRPGDRNLIDDATAAKIAGRAKAVAQNVDAWPTG